VSVIGCLGCKERIKTHLLSSAAATAVFYPLQCDQSDESTSKCGKPVAVSEV
jgi:hypothetical protein